jgi:hypothetical protein
MKTDWTAFRVTLCALLEDGGPEQFFAPTFLEALVDLRDRAPVDFQHLRQLFKRRHVVTDLDRAMKAHGYVPPPASKDPDPRPQIPLSDNMVTVIDAIIGILAMLPVVFVRDKVLVRLVGHDSSEGPTAMIYTLPSMHELLTSAVRLCPPGILDEGLPDVPESLAPCEIERMLVEALLARGDYPGVRRLLGVTTAPIVHADGSLCTTYGFDPASGYFCAYRGPALLVPEAPTRDDARRALALLAELVEQFPFAEPMHRSAWLSGLFTLLLRPTIDGFVPCHLFDANRSRTGKTLLADLLGAIVLGHPLARTPYTDDDKELTATIAATLTECQPAALFDNIDKPFGGATMDLLLTAPYFRFRVYGQNTRTLTLPVRTAYLGTGNHIQLRGDMAERTITSRLDTPLENPQLRTDLKDERILKTTLVRRGELLTAALTAVRAFTLAERPEPEIAPLGSFYDWCAWVRNLLIWLDQPDPVETQAAAQEERDTVLIALHEAWIGQFGEAAATIHEAIEAMREAERDLKREEYRAKDCVGGPPDPYVAELKERVRKTGLLKASFKELGMQSLENASLKSLGKRFRDFHEVRCKGRMFVQEKKNNTNAWKVVHVGPPPAPGAAGEAPIEPTASPAPPAPPAAPPKPDDDGNV